MSTWVLVCIGISAAGTVLALCLVGLTREDKNDREVMRKEDATS